MRILARTALLLTIAATGIASTPEYAAAKCRPSIGHPVLPGYAFILDGKVVGEYAMDADAPLPPSEEIVSMEVICRNATNETGGQARQAALVVLTRTGLPLLFTSYLGDLVEAQRQFHAQNGNYAANLEELGFFESRMSLPISMVLTETGWIATAQVQGAETVCQVAVESAERRRSNRTAGAPVCFST